MNDTVLRDVRQIAADVLNKTLNEVPAAGTRDTVAGWDSMAHVNLVLALEQHFDIQFRPEDEELAQFYAGYTKKVASADEDDLLFTVSAAEAETLTDSQTKFLTGHVSAASGRILDIGCGKG